MIAAIKRQLPAGGIVPKRLVYSCNNAFHYPDGGSSLLRSCLLHRRRGRSNGAAEHPERAGVHSQQLWRFIEERAVRMKYGLMWLLGVPIPILIILYFIFH